MMIYGIGTDICRIERFERMLARYGERAARRVLGERELAEFGGVAHPARFLARRFAAKEAFSKALGTGIREPVLLSAMQVGHDELGRPYMECGGKLAALMASRGFTSHLSISDEADHAVAFVVIERNEL